MTVKSKTNSAPEAEVIVLAPLQTEVVTVFLVGTRPLIVHSMSWKAKQELLFPGKKKNRSERESTLKHDPLSEFRECFYDAPSDSPTAIVLPGTAFKGALKSAALRIPGATKTEIGQLVQVEDEWVPIFGIPQLHMSVVRSAGMNKTPDVRSRPIVAKWAAKFHVRFARPQLSLDTVGQLFGAAGVVIGVGDYRPEKGAGDFGRFAIAEEKDAQWNAIAKTGTRKHQEAAIANPECYNRESARLLSWFTNEVDRRGISREKPKKGEK